MELIERLVHLGVKAKSEQQRFVTASGESLDRSRVLSASELGACIRKTKYKKIGAPTNKKPGNWGASERGNAGESWVVMILQMGLDYEGLGGKLLFAGANQISLQVDDISGTPDGLIVYPNGTKAIGLEIKTADPMLHLDEAREKHVIQAELQLELWNRTTDYIVDEVHLVYFNAANYQIITEFAIPRNPDVWKFAKQRAEHMFLNDPEDLLPEGSFQGDCDYCQFSEICKAARLKRIPTEINEPFPDEIEEKLIPLAQQRMILKAEEKDLEWNIKSIDEQIKILMGEADSKRGTAGAYRLSLALVAGRTSYNIEAMREDGIEVSKYASVGSPHTRLTVNKPR